MDEEFYTVEDNFDYDFFMSDEEWLEINGEGLCDE